MTGFPDDDRDPFTDGWPDRDLILRAGHRIAREWEDTMQLLAAGDPHRPPPFAQKGASRWTAARTRTHSHPRPRKRLRKAHSMNNEANLRLRIADEVDQKLTELGLTTLLDRDEVLIGESDEPELITSQSAEDQRAHEEDVDD